MTQEVTPTRWYRNPLWLGLVGLALMVGGWKLMTFAPLSPRERASAERLGELRRMAEETDNGLSERLDRAAGNLRPRPPFLRAGRVAVLVGLVLFVTAGVQMYRRPRGDEEPGEE